MQVISLIFPHCRYYLGEVLEAERDFEEAAKCMTTAIDVQRTSPILDFGIVPLIFE